MTDDLTRTLSMTPGPPAAAPAPEERARALLQQMAAGDESALAMLYDEWSGRVHTLAFWILRDADDAEDVVEETFWQAWSSAGRYEEQRAPGGTWLMIIARSRAIDRLRRRRRRADWLSAPSTAGMLLEKSAAQPGESDTEVSERRAVLNSAIRTLPPEQREALELAYFAGLSHAEIAEQVAQPLGTVKTRIRLAMQKLREKLSFLQEGDL